MTVKPKHSVVVARAYAAEERRAARRLERVRTMRLVIGGVASTALIVGAALWHRAQLRSAG